MRQMMQYHFAIEDPNRVRVAFENRFPKPTQTGRKSVIEPLEGLKNGNHLPTSLGETCYTWFPCYSVVCIFHMLCKLVYSRFTMYALKIAAAGSVVPKKKVGIRTTLYQFKFAVLNQGLVLVFKIINLWVHLSNSTTFINHKPQYLSRSNLRNDFIVISWR